jgi:inner membrane protease subunit 2
MTKPQPRNRAAPTPNPRFRVKPQEAPTPKAAEPPAAAPGPALIKPKRRPFFQTSLLTNLRQRFANLPSPVRRTCRTLRWLAPVIPIGLFFPEHVMQVMWVRGPSMTPYLNEDYDQMQTKSDMVLVNMWSWGGLLPFRKERKLERGTVVTFRLVFPFLYSHFFLQLRLDCTVSL